jgi:phosphatidate cytidylyltransferase
MSIVSASPPPASALSARLLTAAILISLLLGVLALDSWLATAVVLGGFLALAGFEWATLLGWGGLPRLWFVGVLSALCALGSMPIVQSSVLAPLLALACAWWLWATLAIIGVQLGHNFLPAGRLPWAILGGLALVPSYVALLWLQIYDRWLLVGLFVLIWSADTAAYFAGRAWGKRRLASQISPGKTWAGALAAVAVAPLVGLLVARLPTSVHLSLPRIAALASVVVIASIVGDLFESLLKRRGGFKDSGTLLPGHGGVLDRIDSLLAAAPIYATALTLMANTR